MLEGRKQERPEFSLLSIRPQMDFVLDQIRKKTLRQILGIVHGIAATAHISVERRPVGLAKLGQGGARDLRVCLGFSRRNNHAPLRGDEGISLAVNGSRQILHGESLTTAARESQAAQKKRDFVQQRLPDPFVNGERQLSPRGPNEK